MKREKKKNFHAAIFNVRILLLCMMTAACLFTFSHYAFAADHTRPAYKKQKIEMENIFNFRTLAGYKSRYGGKIKKGVLYRSGELTFATENDLKKIKKLGIRTVIDLRQYSDYLYCADLVPEGVKVVSRPAYKGGTAEKSIARYQERKSLGLKSSWRIAKGCHPASAAWIYRQFKAKSYGKTLKKIISYGKSGAVLFHCVAGKDRTGNMAAVILMALGVDEDIIAADYALTNDAIASYGLTNTGVSAAKMRSALRKIKKQYGTYEKYLLKAQGVTGSDLKRLRKMFLTK